MILPSLSIVPYAHNRAGSMFTQFPLDGGFTVSSSDQGTIVNADGIIERSPRNLCINTQTFTAASWAQTASPTIADNAEIAPDGTMTAAVMTDGQIQYAAGIGVIGKQYTCSMYIRRISGTGTVRFRAIENINTDIIVTSEWQRFSLTVAATTTTLRIGINLQSGTSTVAIWGAQIEESLTPTPYQRIDASRLNFPRIDWLGQSCPALLVEPAATNLVPSGTAFVPVTDLSFTNTSNSPALSISGTLITKITGVTGGVFAQQTCLTSLPSGSTTYTISRFFKYNGTDLTTSLQSNLSTQWGGTSWNQQVVISAASGVTLGTSTNCTGSVENYGNGWYRVSVRLTTGASPSGSTNVQYIMLIAGSVASGSSFLTALPQLEVGSVATTYIPTTSGAVGRAADVISASGVSGLIGQTEGTIYAEVDVRSFASTAARRIVNLRVDGNNLLSLEINTAGTSFDFVAVSGGGSITATASGITTGISKIAVGYNSAASGTAIYVNGTLRDTKTISIPNLSAAVFGLGVRGDGAAGSQLNDRIRAAALYTTRLDNYDLMAMTSLDTSYEQLAARLSYAT